MPNYEELAKGINQPFGGVGQMQPAPGADPGFKPTLDPVLLLNAAKAVGEYFRNQITQPIQGTMDAARMGQYNVAPGQGVAPNPMNPLGATMMGIGAGWKGGLPAGATGVGMTFKTSYPTFEAYKKSMEGMGIPLDVLAKKKAKGFFKDVPATEAEYMARANPVGDWTSIKSAIDSIPKHKPGGLDLLTDLRAKFPDMPKAEFDEMMLKLSREGKISLHHHDMPGSYKGEMIKDGKTFYHAFGVKPEWR